MSYYTPDPREQRNRDESVLAQILTQEEEENLGKCLRSISPFMHITSFAVGGALSMGACYKFVPKRYVQWIGFSGGMFSLLMSRMAAIQSCIKETAPALLDPRNRELLQSKLSNFNNTQQSLVREPPAQTPEEPSPSLPSALEFDDPVSSTQSFSDLTPIATVDEADIVQQKKPITYEELRKKHREEYQREYRQRVVSRPRERASEEPQMSDQPHRHRNKYGDEME